MTANNPITIVIPAYNRAHTLGRTLSSIDAQTVAPARVVLVDNASSDTTLDLMRSWASKPHDFSVTVLTEDRRGACCARNRGLREVATDFVMFFDSDDVMLPCHVRDFTDAICRNPEIDIFGRSIVLESIGGKRRKHYFAAKDPLFNHLFRASLSTQRIVVRTSLVRNVGGWDDSLFVWDDFELGVRLLLANGKIKQVPGKPSVVAYQQESSISGLSFKPKAGQWEAVLDQIESILVSAGRSDMVKWIDCRRLILAANYACEPGGEPLARVLVAKTMARGRAKMRLRLIYLHNRYCKRLTWMLAKILLAV